MKAVEHFTIFNAQGKWLQEGVISNDSFEINVEKLTPGLYLFKLKDAEIKFTKL